MNPEEKLVFDFITDNNLFFDLIPHGANAQCNFCGKMESCGWRESAEYLPAWIVEVRWGYSRMISYMTGASDES